MWRDMSTPRCRDTPTVATSCLHLVTLTHPSLLCPHMQCRFPRDPSQVLVLVAFRATRLGITRCAHLVVLRALPQGLFLGRDPNPDTDRLRLRRFTLHGVP